MGRRGSWGRTHQRKGATAGRWFRFPFRSALEAAICLVPSRDAEDDHESCDVVDGVHDSEVADPEPPPVGASQVGRTRWARVEPEGEDRPPKTRRDTWREAAQLTGCCRRELDPVRVGAGHSPVPYSARVSAARESKKSAAAVPPSRSYSASASAADARSSRLPRLPARRGGLLRQRRARCDRTAPPRLSPIGTAPDRDRRSLSSGQYASLLASWQRDSPRRSGAFVDVDDVQPSP